MKKKKTFDCVEMKRRAQEQIRRQVQGMTPAEEIEFFRQGQEAFAESVRKAAQKRKSATGKKAAAHSR